MLPSGTGHGGGQPPSVCSEVRLLGEDPGVVDLDPEITHSTLQPASRPGMLEVAWHAAPQPALTVRLDGSVEYRTSDGEVREAHLANYARGLGPMSIT